MLIELILTMMFSAILAGIVVEIIAAPIRSYFWHAERRVFVEAAEASLESIQTDLKNSLLQSVVVQNGAQTQVLTFRKILYKGIVLPKEIPQLPDHFIERHQEEPLYIVFPSSDDKLYPFSFINNQNLIDLNLQHPAPFYIIGPLTRYECLRNDHLLERIIELNNDDRKKYLMTNEITDCQFSRLNDGERHGVLVSLTFGQAKTRVQLTQPIFYITRQ